MLELRLRELQGQVDKFIIVESDHTFTGKLDEISFQSNKNHLQLTAKKYCGDCEHSNDFVVVLWHIESMQVTRASR